MSIPNVFQWANCQQFSIEVLIGGQNKQAFYFLSHKLSQSHPVGDIFLHRDIVDECRLDLGPKL